MSAQYDTADEQEPADHSRRRVRAPAVHGQGDDRHDRTGNRRVAFEQPEGRVRFGERHRFSSRVTALTVLTTFTMPAATPKKKNTMTKIGEVPSQRSSR